MVEKTSSSYRLADLEQTVSQLNNEDCLIIAGGTDVMVVNKSRRGTPAKMNKSIVFIDHLQDLKQVYTHNHDIHIGACCTYSELLEDTLIPPIFKKAMKQIAAPAIRNRGTIGGNICNASPAGDMLPLLYVYNAKLLLRSLAGDRFIEIADFIQGPRRVQRRTNELLVEVILPNAMVECTHAVFEKIANRRADAITKISFAGLLCLDHGTIKDTRLAFGAVGPTIIGSFGIEQKLMGKVFPLDGKVIDEVVSDFNNLINPIDDQRSTAAYRKTVALKLLRYFLESKEL